MMECQFMRIFAMGDGRACLLQKFGAFPDASVCETVCKGDPDAYDRAQEKAAAILNVQPCKHLDDTTGDCIDPMLDVEQCLQLQGMTCRYREAPDVPCASCGDKGAT